MKKARNTKPRSSAKDDLLPEYDTDYSKARPNRFAARFSKESVAAVLDPDISRVFTSPKSVNAALRSLLATMPKRERAGKTS